MRNGINEYNYIYMLKSLAIFSVVCAHTASIPSSIDGFSLYISNVLHSLGAIGVPVFFIVSGYLFAKTKRDFMDFLKVKVIKIIIPWIFCETIVWLYIVLRKGNINFMSWIKFVLGFNHSTYYLTVLILFYVIYYQFRSSKGFLIFTSMLSVISIVLTSLEMNLLNTVFVTPYMNPVNWMVYFSLGILIDSYGSFLSIVEICYRYIGWFAMAFIGLVIMYVINGDSFSYWSKMTLINTPISVALFAGFSYKLTKINHPMLLDIGKQSFTIYLLHELVVGIVNRGTLVVDNWLLILSRPFIVIMFCMIGIKIYKKIFDQSDNNIRNLLLGIR